MEINGIHIAVERKNIKNLHLAVYPPDARVHVSAPAYLDDNDIRSFVISKWSWVETQRESILTQARQTEREYVTGESFYIWEPGTVSASRKSHASHIPSANPVTGSL